MTTNPTDPSSTPEARIARVRVFVDFWNLQLSLNEKESLERGVDDYRFKIDWKVIGPWLAKTAAQTVGIPDGNHSFEGMIVYASFNPKKAEGMKFKNWATTWLDRQPGITVECRERKPRSLPRCPSCYRDITDCPHCSEPIVSTIEKGVDTLIATDMIRLAWEDAYDLAVLATSDSDLVPAAEFLKLKARKVIQAGFPPLGVELATACWASFDVYPKRRQFERT